MTFIKNNYLSSITASLFILFALASCGDDPVSSGSSDISLDQADNPIAVIIEAQEQEQVSASMAPMGKYITICYEDGECVSREAGGSLLGGEGSTSTLKVSESDRTVVGISANIDISSGDEEGTGVVYVTEVDDGSGDSESGGAEFYRSDVVGPGDEVVFEIGEVEE